MSQALDDAAAAGAIPACEAGVAACSALLDGAGEADSAPFEYLAEGIHCTL